MTEHVDLLAIGETMAMVTTRGGERLAESAPLVLRAAGAESNVAVSAAHAGLRSMWFSALGVDPLGDAVLRQVAVHDVDVSRVRRDASRPTGVMFKDPDVEHRSVQYYRAGSAASALAPDALGDLLDVAVGIVHVSGITAALSASCAQMLDAIVRDRVLGDAVVAFDVNHRAHLWRGDDAGPRLVSLARSADVVFVGLDEAHALWGSSDADAVAELLDVRGTLVVKDGGRFAVSYADGVRTAVPAHAVDVVDAVGAGDAFAAGWLVGLHEGADAATRLARGHAAAARVLRSTSDVPDALPPLATADRT